MNNLVRIIAHWSVTTYKADDDCKRHYHYVLEDDGTEVAGFKRPEANISTSDKDYVGHTLNCNQGSIGVSCAAMACPTQEGMAKALKEDKIVKAWFDALSPEWKAKAWKQDFNNPGPYPVLQPQFEAMCQKIAVLCKRYGIAVTPKTVLMHGEVQKTLGIKQRGKWDIGVLPYAGLKTVEECGNHMRKLVAEGLAKL